MRPSADRWRKKAKFRDRNGLSEGVFEGLAPGAAGSGDGGGLAVVGAEVDFGEVEPLVIEGVLDEDDGFGEEAAGMVELGPADAGEFEGAGGGRGGESLGEGDVGVVGEGLVEAEGVVVEDGVDAFKVMETGSDGDVDDVGAGEEFGFTEAEFEGVEAGEVVAYLADGIAGRARDGTGGQERNVSAGCGTGGFELFAEVIQERRQRIGYIGDQREAVDPLGASMRQIHDSIHNSPKRGILFGPCGNGTSGDTPRGRALMERARGVCGAGAGRLRSGSGCLWSGGGVLVERERVLVEREGGLRSRGGFWRVCAGRRAGQGAGAR